MINTKISKLIEIINHEIHYNSTKISLPNILNYKEFLSTFKKKQTHILNIESKTIFLILNAQCTQISINMNNYT